MELCRNSVLTLKYSLDNISEMEANNDAGDVRNSNADSGSDNFDISFDDQDFLRYNLKLEFRQKYFPKISFNFLQWDLMLLGLKECKNLIIIFLIHFSTLKI